MKSIPDWLILSIWRALIGEIYSSIRAIAISLEENDRTLTIRYYIDREPTEFDLESLEVVATNISASIGLDKVAHIELECRFELEPIGKLDCLDGFVYCRREYDF